MKKEEKIKIILEAFHAGMPKVYIDTKGHGNAVRRLLKGANPKDKTIDLMYHSVIKSDKKYNIMTPNLTKSEGHEETLSAEEKTTQILTALENGIPKSKLDCKCHGSNIDKLKIEKISNEKLEEIHNNLIAIEKEKNAKTPTEIDLLRSQVNQLKNEVKTLKRICSRQTREIKELSAHQNNLSKPKSLKVLGLTITLKTDIIRGKRYKRWYAIFKDFNKRRFIYIGIDRSKASKKITAWFERRKKESK